MCLTLQSLCERPQISPLPAEEIHLWWITGADQPLTDLLSGLEKNWLDEQETNRSTRITHVEKRNIHRSTRMALRYLLGSYLQQHPADIRFTFNQQQKPRLAGTEEDRGLTFNLAHCGGTIVLAFGWNRPLGVDLETHIKPRRLERLAAACFTASEYQHWQARPDQDKQRTFYQYWTAKEAFVKATGAGIAMGLQRLEIDADFRGFVQVPEEAGPADAWQLHGWEDEQHALALVSRGSGAKIRFCNINPTLRSFNKRTTP